MTKKNEKIIDENLAPSVVAEVIPSEDEVFEDEFDIRAGNLQKEIEEHYSDEWVRIFKRLAYEITVIGLPLEEACVIANVDYERLMKLMQADPLIGRLIKTKDLEYKRGLLKTVNMKAKTDEKLSLQLLQARFPDEFNPRKGTGGGGEKSEDLLGIAVEFIQRSGDNLPLVTEKAGKITMVKRTSAENNDIMKRISEILK